MINNIILTIIKEIIAPFNPNPADKTDTINIIWKIVSMNMRLERILIFWNVAKNISIVAFIPPRKINADANFTKYSAPLPPNIAIANGSESMKNIIENKRDVKQTIVKIEKKPLLIFSFSFSPAKKTSEADARPSVANGTKKTYCDLYLSPNTIIFKW